MAKAAIFIKDDGEVRVRTKENGVVITKITTLEAVAGLFVEAAKEPPPPEPERWLTTPLLPPNTVAYRASEKGHIWVVIGWEPEPLPFLFEKTLFQAIPYPKLLFKIQLFQDKKKYSVGNFHVAAVKEGELKPETQLYHYPYSHVNMDWMCIGASPVRELKALADLRAFPRRILTIPNLDHSYSSASNKSGLVIRELLESLDGTKTFPEEWLNPLPWKLKEWIKNM